MTDTTIGPLAENKEGSTQMSQILITKRLKKRYASEKRFRRIGASAILISILFLVLLLGSIFYKGVSAFTRSEVTIPVNLDASTFSKQGEITAESLKKVNYVGLIKSAYREVFPTVKGRRDKKSLYGLFSSEAPFLLRRMVEENPELIGKTISLTIPFSDDADMYIKGFVDMESPEKLRRISDKQAAWIDSLVSQGAAKKVFNTDFFISGDSREPELAGIMGAVMGSFRLLLVALLISFPIGVMAAIYLEEFAPKNKLTDIIEVNINNLAAVPSIIFGLLGLAFFLNIFGLPRSSSLVGGMVLSLMTLPTIIIASRASIKSVPPSIRQAAMAMGASPLQVVLQHVLPLAMPGILTGTIIGMAQALGETAPLLMIGMVAFIVDIPQGFTDPASALPVQIYLWADSPERLFEQKTAAAIMVLVAFLIVMNFTAVLLRKKFERRW